MDLTFFLSNSWNSHGTQLQVFGTKYFWICFCSIFFRPSGDSSHLEEIRSRGASESTPQSSCTASLKRIMLTFSLLFKGRSDLVAKFDSRRIHWSLVVLVIILTKKVSLWPFYTHPAEPSPLSCWRARLAAPWICGEKRTSDRRLRHGETFLAHRSLPSNSVCSSFCLIWTRSYTSWYVRSGLNSHYFHIIGDKLINPSP